ncbi:hypothetical protein [Microtetraspora sp. NBRC 16547]|uniref:hypothetical protein n=1 Tax=Microtetraspora sp. NBRC 16547 TaxID=3030993 RepID=UPI0024A4A73F|nr:hypothetical protein [Microtetraspora sp. NBRC 16547]GLW99383.1 hypothetical protein Misp02_34700 [Microtetraspora sp. NBRC 16547]
MSGWSDTAQLPADDEHQRFARYLQELADVRQKEEAELVRSVLRDPDTVMAQSAVVRHLDRRAAQLLNDPGFADWFHAMSMAIGEQEFLVHRLQEWTLLRVIAVNAPWRPEDLLAASDWFQRTAVQILTSPAALRLLASEGRTRRVRTAADRWLTEQRR